MLHAAENRHQQSKLRTDRKVWHQTAIPQSKGPH